MFREFTVAGKLVESVLSWLRSLKSVLNLQVFNAASARVWQNIRLLDVWKLVGLMWGGNGRH